MYKFGFFVFEEYMQNLLIYDNKNRYGRTDVTIEIINKSKNLFKLRSRPINIGRSVFRYLRRLIHFLQVKFLNSYPFNNKN